MGPSATKLVDDSTPEDVAALYRWANLTGAKYRDYSAERREQRAQMRYRAAKQQLEQELQAAAGMQAGDERVQEALRVEIAARAALRALEEEREIAEAHQSARRKQGAFEEAERQRRERTGRWPGVREGAVLTNVLVRVDAAAESSAGSAMQTVRRDRTAPEETQGTAEAIRPAWLGPAAELAWLEERAADTVSSAGGTEQAARRSSLAGETLLDWREQVALRWPALQALAQELRRNAAAVRMSRRRGPVVAIISPAGGAGATSLAAMLARSLAKDGERVLLVETAAQGLLPLYFGMARLEPGELRSAAVREDEAGAVFLFALHLAVGADEKRMQEDAVEALMRAARTCSRIVIDLAPGAEWMVRRLAAVRPMVLAPVAPEMSSVAGLLAMEQTFAAITDDEGRSLLPFYVLNRFDAGLPLHLDIREVLRRELNGRLLSVAVRRSGAVGEALAEGRTVLDYAADSPVARDYRDVARWLEETASASAEAIADAERGER